MNKILQRRIEEAARNYAESLALPEWDKRSIHAIDLKKGAIFALQNQWISVEEALPESIAQRVLIVNNHFPFDVYFGRYEYGKWIIEGESENLWITHWAPIPELKGGEE